MEFKRDKAIETIKLVATVGADRLMLAALPSTQGFLGKALTEAIALVLAVLLVMVVIDGLLTRPRVVVAWQVIAGVEEDGPALTLPASSSYLTFTASMERRGLVSRHALRGLTELEFEIQLEAPRILMTSVEMSTHFAVTPHDSLTRTRIGCVNGGERIVVRLKADATAAPPGVQDVTVHARWSASMPRRVKRYVALQSPVVTIRW